MSVLFDAQSSLDFTSSNSFTHTPVGFPRGVVVLIAQTATASDLVSAVTYGGVALTRVPTNGFATDSAVEPGAAYLYFLGSGIPTGAQSVAMTVASGTDAKTAWCLSLTAHSDTEVAASSRLLDDQTNPSVTLATVAGYQGVVCAVFYSGLAAPSSVTAGAGYTLFTSQRDFGNQAAVAQWGQKTGASVVCNFTAAGDDAALCFAAIREKTLPTVFTNYQGMKAESGISVTEKIR